MALSAGSIEADDDGEVSGTGLALAIYNGALSGITEEQRRKVAQAMAPFCNGLAAAIVEHIVANAEVTVTVTSLDSGLQRVPDPATPGSPTAGPATDKTFSGTLI